MEKGIARKRRGRTWIGWLGGLFVVVLGLTLAGAVYESVAEAADARSDPPPGQLVDVGGYRMHINCAGIGSPTVVIDAGLGDWSTNWSWVQPEVAKMTRVCTYDRAGDGWSEVGPQPRTAQQFVNELYVLLKRADVPGPYVLVGHSLGGFTARLFAHDYASEVAGIVLIEATHPSEDAQMPTNAEASKGPQLSPDSIIPALARVGVFRLVAGPLGLSSPHLPPEAKDAFSAISVRPQYFQSFLDETRGIPEGSVQVRAVKTLGNVPLIVLSRGLGEGPSDAAWQLQQTALLQLSSNSQQLIADKSGHNIEIDQPEAANRAIMKMVELTRKQ